MSFEGFKIYEIGTEVKLRLYDVKGLITAAHIYGKSVTYTISFYDPQLGIKELTFSEFEFTTDEPKFNLIGFKE